MQKTIMFCLETSSQGQEWFNYWIKIRLNKGRLSHHRIKAIASNMAEYCELKSINGKREEQWIAYHPRGKQISAIR